MLTRKLPVKLTNDEVRMKGKRMAVLQGEIQQLGEEKKEIVSDFTSKINGRTTEILKLTREINEGAEYRQVEIVERKDWIEREVQVIRQDTGEVVDARPMTPAELQRPIPFGSRADDDDIAGDVLDEVADQINEGALGPNVRAIRKQG